MNARLGRGMGRVVVAALAAAAVLVAGPARAQDQIRDFRQPILMAETEGHHAPVRALIWPDAATLLSAGMDKVVKVWDVRDGNRLVRTIRPPIWRGPAGVIHAMALAPKPNAPGQRLLAVGGVGVQNFRGDITVFRYPGQDRSVTGDPAARLLCRDVENPSSIGHANTVMCLGFDPTGRILASGSMDQTVVLWDMTGFRPLRVLRGHTGAVNALSFTPDGRTLVTAGSDGSVRTWDVARGVQLDARLGHPERPDKINTLAMSPDGAAVVVGTENGNLFRFDARNLQVPTVQLPTRPDQGPVEFAAYHPDGRRLVTNIKADKRGALESQGVLACDVELRDMPAGTVARTWRVSSLVYACGFSPDRFTLAYSGGASQAIYLQDLRDLNAPPTLVKGQGSTILDIGFTADSQVVGFTRERAAAGGPAPLYQGFDAGKRTLMPIAADRLKGTVRALDGWTVRSDSGNFVLEAVHADGRRWKLDVDPAKERLWWSYTFIPKGPGHDKPTLAIGCEAGVIVYDLGTGERTRMYAGHAGPITSLAPSPDGRWLASGSLDQAVMLYSLAGCDRLPPFGADFLRVGDAMTVAKVAPRGFAAAMGLATGDVLVKAGIGNKPYQTAAEFEQFVALLDGLKPNSDIGIQVRRRIFEPVLMLDDPFVLPPTPSTKRDNPALMLLAGLDREWVWAPQGYYETSIEGDSRLLGWHINAPFDQARPTDYVPISAYAAKMRRPAVLDTLWRTADIGQALALVADTPRPEQVAEQDQPPRIEIAPANPALALPPPGQPWVVAAPNPQLVVTISSQGKSPIAARRLVLDETLVDRPALPAPVADLRDVVPLTLVPNQPSRLFVKATNANGSPRTAFVDVVYVPPAAVVAVPDTARAPRMRVLSIGSDTFASPDLPPVRFAIEDAEGLADFFGKHLIPHGGGKPFEVRPRDQTVLTSKAATTESIVKAFDQLRSALQNKELDKGDLVVVVLATHVLDVGKTSLIAASDTAKIAPPRPSLPGLELAERLGELSDYGCRAILFLDGVHEIESKELKGGVKELVRDLQQNRQVITFIASKEGPSGLFPQQRHGYFAFGLLHAFEAGGAAGGRRNRNEPYNLGQFKTAVVQQVLTFSSRQQEVGCYTPLSVPLRTWFARP